MSRPAEPRNEPLENDPARPRGFGLLARLSPSRQAGLGAGHLGKRRALRLSALLAPRNRRRLAAVGGLIILLGIGLALAGRAPEPPPPVNAIWLDRALVYGELDDERMKRLAGEMRQHGIGTAYAFASALGADSRWSGGARGESSFMDSRAELVRFAEALKSHYESLKIYAWIEIWTHLDPVDGYRLDEPELHQNVADFARLLATQLGFDGVLLDVKPMFSDNDDFIRLARAARAEMGGEKPLAVAVAADLTPPDPRLEALDAIAPGTMWSSIFKSRVMHSADELVLLLFQSYRREAEDYVNWVAYHVETYVSQLEEATRLMVSAPSYRGGGSAHDPAIETLALSLDGIGAGLDRLDEDRRALLNGIAIFADGELSQSDWSVFREKWLER